MLVPLLLLTLAGPPVPLGPATLQGADERVSLEKLLDRARAERQVLHQRLTSEVKTLVDRLESLEKPYRGRKVTDLVDAVVALGAEATPLLVPRLDPGVAALEKERFRSEQVAEALLRMNTLAITNDLLRLMEQGTEQGRRNAVRVLESSPEPERVRPALRALFEKSAGRLRETCLRSLLELGGEQDTSLLKQVLAGEDAELAGLALRALTDTRNAEAAPQVRKLLSSSRTATVQARGLIAYFEAMPELVTREDLTAFVAIATGGGSLETRIAVVDAIPRFQPSLNSELRRAFEPLVGSRDKQLKEAALVALASLGDKSSKKALLEEYDELVDRNDRWSEAYFRRAEINRRIGDHDAAIKDYLKALNVAKNDPTLQPNTYVGLARSYTRKGKYKDAAEWLRKAPISMAELANLAEDPEFAPLRESRYGKEVFKD